MEDYKKKLMESIKSKLNLKAVETPRLINPFDNMPNKERRLWRQLEYQQRSQIVPVGYGFLPGEDGYGMYDPVETLDVGVGTKKPCPIILPEAVWLPRTVLWVQALEAMTLLTLTD